MQRRHGTEYVKSYIVLDTVMNSIMEIVCLKFYEDWVEEMRDVYCVNILCDKDISRHSVSIDDKEIFKFVFKEQMIFFKYKKDYNAVSTLVDWKELLFRITRDVFEEKAD